MRARGTFPPDWERRATGGIVRSRLQFSLAKVTAFACLLRHAVWNLLRYLVAARHRARIVADAKNSVTYACADTDTDTDAGISGVPACINRVGSKLIDQHHRRR